MMHKKSQRFEAQRINRDRIRDDELDVEWGVHLEYELLADMQVSEDTVGRIV